MAIIRIDVAESISSNPFALQQVVDQIIDQIDDLNTGGTGGGSGNGDTYTLTATDGDGEVTVNLLADVGDDSSVVLRAGNGITINESGGTITFTGAGGPDLGNFVTVNTSTGEIQAGTTTFQYLYRYLHIAFATAGDGTDFTTDPATITGSNIFIGTFNSSLTTPPDNASDYSYREFVWSSEHNVFLRTVGGHQIEFLTSLQAIISDASPYDVNDNPLDFDILQINNGNIVDGAVSVEKLSIDQLSAITADVGVLSAGVIRGGNLTTDNPFTNDPGASGAYVDLTLGNLLFGDADSHLRYNALDDQIGLVGDVSTTNEIVWVPSNATETHNIQVNSNTFSNQTANRNSHYAADGLSTTTDGNFWVGHAETPINDSNRQFDRANSTGIEITTVEFTLPGENELSSRTVMGNAGTIAFFPSGDEQGAVFYESDNATMLPVDNGQIRASQYENKGLSNVGNSVILGTDAEHRMTANYPGGTPIDFTQFSTGKEGSSSGQAIIGNNNSLILPAGTYAISVEELAAARGRTTYQITGDVGQVSSATFSYDETQQSIVQFDGDVTSGDTIINNATAATGLTRVRLRAIDDSLASQLLFLLGGDDGYDHVLQDDSLDGVQLQVDSSRNLNVSITRTSDPDFLITINGIRRVDVNINDPEIDFESVELYIVSPSDSSENADSFLVNIPNGFSSNNDLVYEISYDRGVPSGITLFETGQTPGQNSTVGVAPITFNENISSTAELLSRFESQFLTIINDGNNGISRFGDQEIRFDSANSGVIITQAIGGIGSSNFVASVQGTDGNFETENVVVVGPENVVAHKFGIDVNSSNSVYGGWFQGQRLNPSNNAPVTQFNTGVNGVYDQSAGNFDVYGSRQFDVIPDNNSNVPGAVELITTNNSNTELVRSNFMWSDQSGLPQSGLMVVSSVGPMELSGEFYSQTDGNMEIIPTNGAGILMQYKEIQS